VWRQPFPFIAAQTLRVGALDFQIWQNTLITKDGRAARGEQKTKTCANFDSRQRLSRTAPAQPKNIFKHKLFSLDW
jgi:hypothetical protein